MNQGRQFFILFAVVAGALLSTGCVSYLHSLLPPAAYPEIRLQPGAALPAIPDYTFEFEDFTVTLSSPADPEVIAGARAAKKEVRMYDTSFDDEEWRAGLYSALATDPAQDRFFEDLTNEFQAIRNLHNLNSDEYLELIAVFVQSIPYKSQNLSSPKYPIETYGDREGDCDDKSLLLAGLLAHEGYKVALLYFGPEQHMAVGVACPEKGYRDTGYAFIETTRVSLVGTGPDSLAGDITIASDPLVIPIGDRTLGYTRCNETIAIYAELTDLSARLEEIRKDLGERESSLMSGRSDLEDMDLALGEMESIGNYSGYNRMVSEYNKKVWDYNQDLDIYNNISEEYARLAERYNYIIAHEHDRAGTYHLLFGAVSGDVND
jgi:hypothetical protein